MSCILATGFKTTDYLGTLEVTGRDGRTLQEVWADEPSGFLGLDCPGLPQFLHGVWPRDEWG